MAAYTEIKRGDTLHWTAELRDDDAAPPTSLTGWQIRAQVRTRHADLLAHLGITIAPDQLSYTLDATPAVTATWPPGLQRLDIEYTDPAGRVVSTETISLRVLEDITT